MGLALHVTPFSTWTHVHHLKKIKSLLFIVHHLTNLFPAVAPQAFA